MIHYDKIFRESIYKSELIFASVDEVVHIPVTSISSTNIRMLIMSLVGVAQTDPKGKVHQVWAPELYSPFLKQMRFKREATQLSANDFRKFTTLYIGGHQSALLRHNYIEAIETYAPALRIMPQALAKYTLATNDRAFIRTALKHDLRDYEAIVRIGDHIPGMKSLTGKVPSNMVLGSKGLCLFPSMEDAVMTKFHIPHAKIFPLDFST